MLRVVLGRKEGKEETRRRGGFFPFFSLQQKDRLAAKKERRDVSVGRFSIIMYDSCCPILLIPLLLR